MDKVRVRYKSLGLKIKCFDVFRKGGYVYICGKISMAEGVENALKDVLKHIGMMDAETAERTFDEMRRNSRYQEDIFG